ncbi:MAG TPA: rhodanese-like domain-containing protein, partial [Rhabdaerophilum sp.]|nr:rhodanese-like domain-containing protein [Rhabdaerophilum sp.]
MISNLDRDEVKAGLANGTLLVVDVREPHEYAQGRIPGAVSRPLSRLDLSDIPEAA